VTPRRSAAATAQRQPQLDATAPRPSRAARPRVRSPHRRRSRPWPGRATSWRPTCPSVPAFDDHQSSQAHPIRVSTLSGQGNRPYPASYPGAAGGGTSITAPGFPLPFGHRHSLLGSSCARREIDFPHGQPTRREHAWIPTGLSRSARDRYDRGGCPLYPGDGGALPPDQVPPGGTCRLTTTGPYLPLKHPTEREC
jgi:hypothetical protein